MIRARDKTVADLSAIDRKRRFVHALRRLTEPQTSEERLIIAVIGQAVDDWIRGEESDRDGAYFVDGRLNEHAELIGLSGEFVLDLLRIARLYPGE